MLLCQGPLTQPTQEHPLEQEQEHFLECGGLDWKVNHVELDLLAGMLPATAATPTIIHKYSF